MDYLNHLQKDKKLKPLLQAGPLKITKRKNVPVRLMASIMSQQLSTKVAAVIYQRFLDLYNGKDPELSQVLSTPDEKLRAIGLSNAKVNYVKNVASFCIEHSITDKTLAKKDNEDIIDLLVQIKGVGRWTVEMLLMFTLGREDVFAVDDLGIQQAMCNIYKIDPADKKAMKIKMKAIAQKWSPYQTYACMHLWRWKDS
ncbi:DNA-3-methyladenine glycosylase family protein [Sediminibacterium sp. TEGAF015]|uniref:DNA-3-methyladenine glycosylase family protein n=1 Tax=Sediminibacterium sp. TEGAF015 TaxID=575378 RepID=UPI00220D3255|nr:DNA-3-methyladenine glycosylase 2 family protein [Sediminibacterium sp. TEGAF015]BDQ12376.1 DNA-3-methyladenine glycosylase [Sediminibacterium sp. TEGAF015]